jgi:glutamate--cysteine ligase
MPDTEVVHDVDSDELSRLVRTRDDAEAFVAGICFKIGPPTLAGIELERLVHDKSDPALPVPVSRLVAALGRWSPPGIRPTGAAVQLARTASPRDPGSFWPYGPSQPLPARGTLTIEPGGQVELSSAAHPTIAACIAAVDADSLLVSDLLRSAGLTFGDKAVDPFRPPVRMVEKPRYAAMERFFRHLGDDGDVMMASTASVQLSVDAGTAGGPDSFDERWHAAYALGPVLVAAFANSPVVAGIPTGWRSARQRAWLGIDPSRTAPPPGAGGQGDPRAGYGRYALDAKLLCLPGPTDRWDAPHGVTFADWIDGALGRRPTYADLDYHLTTLFPPVRPKGFLEVRYLDNQPGDGWRVPVAVLWALLADPVARDAAREAAEPVAGAWVTAARSGLDDPALATAARRVLTIAMGSLGATGVPADVAAQVTEFAEHYTLRGRSPAHREEETS